MGSRAGMNGSISPYPLQNTDLFSHDLGLSRQCGERGRKTLDAYLTHEYELAVHRSSKWARRKGGQVCPNVKRSRLGATVYFSWDRRDASDLLERGLSTAGFWEIL